MVALQVKTKNKVDIDKKPRVYFTCHPDDFEKYFDRICEDIFKIQDCAIYYTENMTERIAEDEKDVILGRNNLFVIPVSFKLLSAPNRAMSEDISYALKEHIPILPIMMEDGIDDLYSKPDKFGEIQYLKANSVDLSEISYDEKLKKYLQSVLISNELANRVRAAFDAYIFLSYRKKDRKYANELMRLIHSVPECRDIAIWFDEFLTPGESFKTNIEKILDDCKLFTLLVTPKLFERVVDENGAERENYVISAELPLARKKKEENGTDIFAVEMEETDKMALSSINIIDYVNLNDENFRERLVEAISRIVTITNDTPEHNFLIGLAYLEGIDVEVNRERAIELITDAAENGLLEAITKLYRMYNDGIGITVDYNQALRWSKEKYKLQCELLGEEHPDSLTSLNDLAYTYGDIGDHRKALELQEKVYSTRCRILGEEHPDTLTTLGNLAYTYGAFGEHRKALELKEKIYALLCGILGEEHPNTLTALNSLAYTYGDIKDHRKALEIQEKVYLLRCKILGEEHLDTLTTLSNLAYTYDALGDHFSALKLKLKVYELRVGTLGEEHPKTLMSLNNLAYTYGTLGEYHKALEIQEKVYLLRCKILGEAHPDTLTTLSNLAYSYSMVLNYKMALVSLEKLYVHQVAVYGDNHPKTLKTVDRARKTREKLYGNN